VTARKPVYLAHRGKMSKRELIWATIRQLQNFNVTELYHAMDNRSLHESSVRGYLTGLVNSGYLLRDKAQRPMRYQLLNDCGIEAPRVRKDGSIVTMGIGNQNMWQAMKILKVFDWQSLTLACNAADVKVTAKTARTYIEALHRGSYLVCTAPSRPGIRALYRFNPRMDTGYKAPMIQRDKSLYDPNLDRVMYTPKRKIS